METKLKNGISLPRKEEWDLGGIRVITKITVREHNSDPAASGAEWNEDRDYPVITGELVFPDGVPTAIQTISPVLGLPLTPLWGYVTLNEGERSRSTSHSGPSATASYEAVRRELDAALGTVREAVDARESRLSLRRQRSAEALAC